MMTHYCHKVLSFRFQSVHRKSCDDVMLNNSCTIQNQINKFCAKLEQQMKNKVKIIVKIIFVFDFSLTFQRNAIK